MRNRVTVSRFAIGLAFLATLFPAGAWAQSSSTGNAEVNRLLDLLVQKHLLTRQEATSVRAEAEQQPPPAPATMTSSQSPGTKAVENGGQSAPQAQASRTPAPQSPATVSLPERTREAVANLPFKIGGYVQPEWASLPGQNNTFEIRRARLNVEGDIGKLASYKFGIETLNQPSLLDAYLRLNFLPQARLTLGQFKVPFSQENLVSSSDLLTVERSQVDSLVPGRDNGSNGRDIGVDVAGTYNFSDSGGIDYAVGIFNGAGVNRKDDNNRKDLALRFAIRPFQGLAFAGDYYNGASGAAEAPRDRQGVEFSYTNHPLTLLSEFIWGREGAIHEQGWYGLGAWSFSTKWQGVFRIDGFNPNRSRAGQEETTYLGGVNWYFAPGLQLRLNYGLRNQQSKLKSLGLSQLQFQF